MARGNCISKVRGNAAGLRRGECVCSEVEGKEDWRVEGRGGRRVEGKGGGGGVVRERGERTKVSPY